MIIDLIAFIHSLSACFHEIIVCIDTNDLFIPEKSGTARLVELTNLVDPLINKFGIYSELPTHQSGSNIIAFLFCTPSIEKFIFRIGILPIHEISPSNHRGYILDVYLLAFLNDLDHIPSSNTRLLSTQSPDSSLIYKTNLSKYILKHNIINQVNTIQDKIESKTLNSSDQQYLNEIDQLITKGMLFSEYKIKFPKFTHPWSPILAVAILSVSIFKLYLSSVKNTVIKTTIIDRLYDKLLSYDTPNLPPKLDTDDKEIINNKLKEAFKNLTSIKRNASKYRQDHLQARVEEADLVGNDKLSYYIRRLL